MTGDRPTRPGNEVRTLEQSAQGLREILEVARALGRISEEGELLDLINTTARDKLECGVCAIAIKGDDGAFRYTATSGLGVDEDRALRSAVLSPAAFEALREAAPPRSAVCVVPPGHPVRERPDVIAGTLLGGCSAAPGSEPSVPLVFVPLLGVDGEPLGLLNPARPLNEPLSGSSQLLLLETLAELTVVGLEIVRARAVEHAAVAVAEVLVEAPAEALAEAVAPAELPPAEISLMRICWPNHPANRSAWPDVTD